MSDDKPKKYPGLGFLLVLFTTMAMIPVGVGVYVYATSPTLNPNLPTKTVYVNQTVEVPKIEYVEKPVIVTEYEIIEKPVIEWKEKIVYVPKYIVLPANNTTGGNGTSPGSGDPPIPQNTTGSPDLFKLTVHAKRVPSEHWGETFEGAGASMFFAFYNTEGTLVKTEFASEAGTTVNLPNATAYLIYPADCELCHESTHDVIFDRWDSGDATRPLLVGNNADVTAWYRFDPNETEA